MKKKQSTKQIKVWLQLLNDKPNRAYLVDPHDNEFVLFAKTLKSIYGKTFKITEATLSYKLPKESV